MTKTQNIFLVFLGLLLAKSPVGASVLENAVVGLQTGVFKTVDIGFSRSLANNENIFTYSNDAVWDPGSRKVLFLNRDHGDPWHFVIYDVETNKWTKGPLPFSGHGGHIYDNLTMDFQNGYMYWFTNAKEFFRYDPAKNSWTTLPQKGSIPTTGHGMGLEYFPEMGGFIHVYGGSGFSRVHFYNLATNTWSRISGSFPMGPYHNLAEYNPIEKSVFFGGGNGSSQMYKIDGAGKTSTVTSPPTAFGAHEALLTCDRVSGTMLLRSESKLYALDPSKTGWATASSGSYPGPHHSVVVSIETFGVVLFLQWTAPHAQLYKYSDKKVGTDRAPQIRGNNFSLLSIPNPFRRSVTFFPAGGFNFGAPAYLTILNAGGQKVTSIQMNNRQPVWRWTPANQAPGTYIAALRSGKKTQYKKIVLER